MANQTHSMVDLARRQVAQRYSVLKADLDKLFKVFPHLRFGSAVSPAMPDGIDEATVRPSHSDSRRAAARERTVRHRMKNSAARPTARGARSRA
jgi:hypothetical protein